MRIFIAIDIPENVRSEIREVVESLRPATGGLRWSRPEGLHITLKFIGEIPVNKVDEVGTLLLRIPPAGAINISIRGAGFFPHEKRPRVFWLGVQSGPELAALAKQIDRELAALGIATEAREYSPHLTLARMNGETNISGLAEKLRKIEPLDMGSFLAREYHLFQSQPAAGGSIYTKLVRIPLRG
jgi:2'-5' RNA ligase